MQRTAGSFPRASRRSFQAVPVIGYAGATDGSVKIALLRAKILW